MRRLRLIAAALVGCATLALAPASASALSPVTYNCNTYGRLTRHYTVAELQHALKTMPVTEAEYNACPQIILSQLNVQLKKHVKLKGDPVGGGLSSTLVVVIIVVVVLICAGGGFLFSVRRTGGEGPEGPPPAVA
jgi:hypothetical protein